MCQERDGGWPEQREKPHRSTLWTWLEQARSNNLLRSDGIGRKNKAFRYWLPEREKFFGPELEPMEELGVME